MGYDDEYAGFDEGYRGESESMDTFYADHHFANAGVNYNGDYQELLRYNNGVPVIDELKVQEMIDAQKRGNQEELVYSYEDSYRLPANVRISGILYYVYIDEIQTPIYKMKDGSYKKTYLIHQDKNCKHAKRLGVYGPFESEKKAKEYIDWRNTDVEKKGVLFCPFCSGEQPDDEMSRQIAEMVRYALINGRTINETQKSEAVYVQMEKEILYGSYKSFIVPFRLEHNEKNKECSFRKSVMKLGPIKTLEEIKKIRNQKRHFFCPECFSKYYDGSESTEFQRNLIYSAYRYGDKIPKQEGYFICVDNEFKEMKFLDGKVKKVRFCHLCGEDCDFNNNTSFLGPYEDVEDAYIAAMKNNTEFEKTYPCIRCARGIYDKSSVLKELLPIIDVVCKVDQILENKKQQEVKPSKEIIEADEEEDIVMEVDKDSKTGVYLKKITRVYLEHNPHKECSLRGETETYGPFIDLDDYCEFLKEWRKENSKVSYACPECCHGYYEEGDVEEEIATVDEVLSTSAQPIVKNSKYYKEVLCKEQEFKGAVIYHQFTDVRKEPGLSNYIIEGDIYFFWEKHVSGTMLAKGEIKLVNQKTGEILTQGLYLRGMPKRCGEGKYKFPYEILSVNDISPGSYSVNIDLDSCSKYSHYRTDRLDVYE